MVKMDYSCGNVRACIKQETANDKKKAKSNILNICEDKLTQKIVRDYYEKTITQRLFDRLVKNKKINLIYFIINNIS